MILREVAIHRYSVYAVCGFPSEEECEVEQFLLEHWDSYGKAMRDLNTALRRWTPQHGPPYGVEERAKRLRDDICEFRARERRVRELPRILFFEDGMRVICTSAFFKHGSTPDHEIDRAVEIRREYFRHDYFRSGLTPMILKGWALP
jgi:hypothetical protein